MSGNTITRCGSAAGHPAVMTSMAPSRAARELGLKRSEFDLAVRLGRIRTVGGGTREHEPADRQGARRRVAREEVDRVRAAHGFPEALRERVRAVGTTEGARLMGIATARFTRLARLGLLVPVKFYLNRYRTVVWLYLAEELTAFAEAEVNRSLLTGRMPETLRSQLDAGVDVRARNWRGRHAGCLLRLTDDPWARAAVIASVLGPEQIMEVVEDPFERAHLDRLKPEPPVRGSADSPVAPLVEKITTADSLEEIGWLRANLGLCLAEARSRRRAPGSMVRNTAPSRQSVGPPSATAGVRPAVDAGGADRPRSPSRSLLWWLRRGGA